VGSNLKVQQAEKYTSDRERINGPSEFTGRFVRRDGLIDEAVQRLDDIARTLYAIDQSARVSLCGRHLTGDPVSRRIVQLLIVNSLADTFDFNRIPKCDRRATPFDKNSPDSLTHPAASFSIELVQVCRSR